MRRAVLVLMTPILLLLSVGSPALSEAQTEPATSRASSLEAEVAELRRLVAEHERRIAALEALLAKPAPATTESADSAATSPSAPTAPAEPSAQDRSPDGADVPPWAREASWRKLQLGMTEEEVLALLGPPDSTREVGFSRTLIYKGNVPGRGFVKGTVKLRDGVVSDLDLPAF